MKQATKITLFGIHNCDTVKKARAFLTQRGIDYQFHDLRKDGITREDIQRWVSQHGMQTILNKRSTSWRQLGSSTQASINDDNIADLLAQHPTLIKRPILVSDKGSLIGFNKAQYAALDQQ